MKLASLLLLLLVAALSGCASEDLTKGCDAEQWRCGSKCIPLTTRCEGECSAELELCETTGDCRKTAECPRCGAGEALCDGECRSTDSNFFLNNDAHCGACDNRCRNSEQCVTGKCECAAGLTRCGDECVNLNASKDHCGACDNPCVNSACAGGTCMLCGPDEVACDVGGCLPKSALGSPKNCGYCGHDCEGGACEAGMCQGKVVAELKKGSGGTMGIAVGSEGVYLRHVNGIEFLPKNSSTTREVHPTEGDAQLSTGRVSPIVASQGHVAFLSNVGIHWMRESPLLTEKLHTQRCDNESSPSTCAVSLAAAGNIFYWSEGSRVHSVIPLVNHQASFDAAPGQNIRPVAALGQEYFFAARNLQSELVSLCSSNASCKLLGTDIDPERVVIHKDASNTDFVYLASWKSTPCPAGGPHGVFRTSTDWKGKLEHIVKTDCQGAIFLEVDNGKVPKADLSGTRDGAYAYFAGVQPRGKDDKTPQGPIQRILVSETGATPEVVVQPKGFEATPFAFSHDGRYLYYVDQAKLYRAVR